MDPAIPWKYLLIGYHVSVAIELPILLIGLSPRHSMRTRVFAGFWLTACTYPIVIIVLPLVLEGLPRALYLAIAETFAPVAECALFWVAFGHREDVGRWSMWRDLLTITLANLASFGIGEVLIELGAMDYLMRFPGH